MANTSTGNGKEHKAEAGVAIFTIELQFELKKTKSTLENHNIPNSTLGQVYKNDRISPCDFRNYKSGPYGY